MGIKRCIGCLQDVEDKINSPGIATICERCSFPANQIPDTVSREFKCRHCQGETNLVGAFSFSEEAFGKNLDGRVGGKVFFYFDCPNIKCARRRISVIEITPQLTKP